MLCASSYSLERNNLGRPRKKIDKDLVFSLASIHCTMKEIAAVCKCSVDTLERRFADHIERGRETAKASLRREMWKAAEHGSARMQIWLSKQHLGMSDKIETSNENHNTNRDVVYETEWGNASEVADAPADKDS